MKTGAAGRYEPCGARFSGIIGVSDAGMDEFGADPVHGGGTRAASVAKQETYLRTGMDEELQTAVLAECQMCQERYFHIVHGAGVAQCGIVLVILVPTVL